MSILNETYVFYGDVYFLQNICVKLSILYLSLISCRQYEIINSFKKFFLLLLVVSFFVLLEILCFITAIPYGMFYYYGLIENQIILLIFLQLFGKEVNKKILSFRVKIIVSSYFFTMVVNAAIELLWNFFGERGSYLFIIIVACGAVIAGFRLWKNQQEITKGIYEVELCQEEKRIRIQALYDTGNRLKDPYSQKGVHIVSEKIMDNISDPVYIPYQSLGNEGDLIPVYYIDTLRIFGEKEIIEQHKIPVGITKEALFEGKAYAMILNEEVF